MKTIGIWGFYFAENFGDDLMALQFAEIVKNLGAKPLVFDLSPILGARYNIDTTSEICDFCSRSEIILIGGGNLLAQDHTWPSGPFMKKTSELRMAAEHWNRPIHAFSIGGDGVDNPEYPYDVEQLLRSKTFKSATVRIKKDIIDMEKRGIHAVIRAAIPVNNAPMCFQFSIFYKKNCWGMFIILAPSGICRFGQTLLKNFIFLTSGITGFPG